MLEQTLRDWWDQARREGRSEGRKEGRLDGMRQVVLPVLNQRFGPLPEKVRGRVERISSQKALNDLTRRVLQAGPLEELGLR